MVRSLEPELSVHISRRRWRCVVDPHLCLSHEGAAFIRGLCGHAEIWLGPEFLNILDSWLLYEREPSALRWPKGAGPDADEVRQALRIWQGLRDTSGAGSGRLCWVRDAVRESCLRTGKPWRKPWMSVCPEPSKPAARWSPPRVMHRR
jgi:hypothetical protein